jgi:hypothetical protein
VQGRSHCLHSFLSNCNPLKHRAHCMLPLRGISLVPPTPLFPIRALAQPCVLPQLRQTPSVHAAFSALTFPSLCLS